jgi:hypothetical protein
MEPGTKSERFRIRWVWLALVGGFVFTIPAPAQYALNWFTIDSGGGTSTGGVYSVNCAIGQPVAGAMSGGPYSVAGGFLSLVSVVQSPGAPLLSLMRSNDSVVVRWPRSAIGFQLEQTPTLSISNSWLLVPPPYGSNATSFQFMISSPTNRMYFRLHKP